MLLSTGLFTGKNGMMVVMLITSVVLIWLGLMALKLRIAIINSLGEASSSLLNKFVLPSEGGGGGGGGSLSGALSATSGGGGAVGQTVSTTMQSAGATAGSTLTKAALTGGAVVGGGTLAGKLGGGNGGGGGNDEHASIATGDGSAGSFGKQSASAQTSSQSKDGADGVSVDGVTTDNKAVSSAVNAAYAEGSSVSGVQNQEAMDKASAASLMQADSLASANGMSSESLMRDAKASEAGPLSGNLAGDTSVSATGAAGADGLSESSADVRGVHSSDVQGHTIGESAAFAKAQDGSLSASLNQDAALSASADMQAGELRSAQAVSQNEGFLALNADGTPVAMNGTMDGTMNGMMSGSMSADANLRGVQAAGVPGHSGLSGTSSQAFSESMGQAGLSGQGGTATSGLRGIQGQMMPGQAGQAGADGASMSGSQVRGLSVGQAAARAQAESGNLSQGRGSLDRSHMSQQADMGRYRNSSLSHDRQVQAMPGEAGESRNVMPGQSLAGVSGMPGQSVSGSDVSRMYGTGGRGTGQGAGISSRSDSHSYRNSLSHTDSRYAVPGALSGGVSPVSLRGGDAHSVGGAGGVGTGVGGRPAGMTGYRPGAMAQDARRQRTERPEHADGVQNPYGALGAESSGNPSPGIRGVQVRSGLSGRPGGGAPGQFGQGPSSGSGSYRRSSDSFR